MEMVLKLHNESSIKRYWGIAVNASIAIMTLVLYFFFYHLEIHSAIFMDEIT